MGQPPRQRPMRSQLTMQTAVSRLVGRHQTLSRPKALKSLCHALRGQADWTRAGQYLSMFQFHPEELTEAGLPYEMVRALESRFPLLIDTSHTT